MAENGSILLAIDRNNTPFVFSAKEHLKTTSFELTLTLFY